MTRGAHTPAVEPRELDVVSWNTEVGRNERKVLAAVRDMIAELDPDVFVFQEARPYIDILGRLEKSHRLFVPTGKSMEAGSCIGLVRKPRHGRLDVHKQALRMKHGWHGPKAGIRHPGRVFLELEAPWWTIVDTHRTRPGWSPNGRAFKEEHAALLASERHCKTPVWASIGDQNIGTRPGVDRSLPGGPWQLAAQIGGRVITTAHGRVDSAVVRGAKGTARQLDDFGSDHNAILFKLIEEI